MFPLSNVSLDLCINVLGEIISCLSAAAGSDGAVIAGCAADAGCVVKAGCAAEGCDAGAGCATDAGCVVEAGCVAAGCDAGAGCAVSADGDVVS